jgi:5,10-methylenetetrahydromethanopterin reductase
MAQTRFLIAMSSEQKFGIGFNCDVDVRTMSSYAAKAEKAGFESFWLHENAFLRDALSYASSFAKDTSTIRIGLACLSVYTRHPVVLAMTAYTLQDTSHGRAVLGLGTGFPARLDLMGIRHDKPIGAIK